MIDLVEGRVLRRPVHNRLLGYRQSCRWETGHRSFGRPVAAWLNPTVTDTAEVKELLHLSRDEPFYGSPLATFRLHTSDLRLTRPSI